MRPEFTKKPAFMLEAAAQKRREFPLFLELLIFYVVYIAATTAIGVVLTLPMMLWLFSGSRAELLLQAADSTGALIEQVFALLGQMPGWMTALMLLANALLGVAAILYCKWFEKRGIRTLGLTGPHALKSYLLGALFGAASFAAVFALTSAFGGVAISGVQPLAALWPTLLMMLCAYVLQSAGEELLVRGYLMTSLSKRYRLPVCIGVSSIVFALLHTGNFGFSAVAFINIVLIGVVLALTVLLSGDLWAACGYHALWNFVSGNVFGLSVSGIDSGDSIFTVEVTGYNTLLTGGDFGLEGSLCTTFVLLAELGVLVFLLSRRTPDPVPEEPEDPEE